MSSFGYFKIRAVPVLIMVPKMTAKPNIQELYKIPTKNKIPE